MPRVFLLRYAPRYPRALGLGVLALAGACSRAPSGVAEELDGTSSASSVVMAGGAVAPPFDAGNGEVPSDGPAEADGNGEASAPKDGGIPEASRPDAARHTTGSGNTIPRTAGIAPHSFDDGHSDSGRLEDMF